MITKSYKILIGVIIIGIIISTFIISFNQKVPEFPRVKSTSSPGSSIEDRRDRDDYFFMLTRDPSTNKIPQNIRKKELDFIKQFNSLQKTKSVNTLAWKEAGPIDVGGRTRALAFDVNNSNIIIAGGVSGGIWKSTDKGQTWVMKSTTDQLLSVTSVAQDKRDGHTNTWYYCTGEFTGNSARDAGARTSFFGNGIFKSTDNGETWNQLPATANPNTTEWDGNFEYSSKIVVSATGSVFVAANAFGIFRSKNDGNSFELILGGLNNHIFSDITVASDGTILAAISSPYSGVNPTNQPGIYKSTNDGNSWVNITPVTFPDQHERTVLGSAPSNADVLYALTYTGSLNNKNREDIRFYKINVGSAASSDRSANLPDFTGDGGYSAQFGFYTSQGNYDMVMAVKPDDENFVLIGGTSLFRSTNGFSSVPISRKNTWIGGYHPNDFFYPEFHPDIHSFAFDPNNANVMIWGNDGGLSFTNNITNTSFTTNFPWEDKNKGYNVTQFYHCSIADVANDNRVMGGAQDNGSPFFTFDGNTTSASSDVSTGDGGYSYFASNYAYTSSQSGNIARVNYNNAGQPDYSKGWTTVYPKDAQNQLFITPFQVDPNDENVMYYPSGNKLWRNNQLSSIPNFQQSGTDVGWTQLNVNIPSGYLISSVAISKSPAHVLYYAISSFSDVPKIFRLSNSDTQSGPGTELTIAGADKGAYVHNIAINPDDADDIIAVLSNYNIKGIYHSTDGGQNFNPVEGNLEGTTENPGPSVRAACILPTNNGTKYFAATSVGVFSTSNLNGNSTSWTQEGSNTIGNVVVNFIASRKSDGKVVAATHGRGIFVANATGGGNAVASVDIQDLTIGAKPGQTGSSKFLLKNVGDADLNFNITATGVFQLLYSHQYVINKLSKPIPFKTQPNDLKKVNLKPEFANPTALSGELPSSTSGSDVVVYDDGDNSADNFLGYGAGGDDFGWANKYQLDKGFTLDGFQFFMRTVDGTGNNVYAAVYDKDRNVLASGNISLDMAQNGKWYDITINPVINFSAGEEFYLYVETKGSKIPYPAGVDLDGQVINKSFYWDGTKWVNFNTISTFENSAALIRAVGTFAGGTQNRLTVNPAAGTIPANSQQEITVTLNAADLQPDNYNGEINISTNGGDINLPLKMIVSNILDVSYNKTAPSQFTLEQNYPNPFNPTTVIQYSLPVKQNVNIKIYDLNGREIKELFKGEQNIGTYEVSWNGTDSKGSIVSSGVYLYSIQTPQFEQTRKMILMK